MLDCRHRAAPDAKSKANALTNHSKNHSHDLLCAVGCRSLRHHAARGPLGDNWRISLCSSIDGRRLLLLSIFDPGSDQDHVAQKRQGLTAGSSVNDRFLPSMKVRKVWVRDIEGMFGLGSEDHVAARPIAEIGGRTHHHLMINNILTIVAAVPWIALTLLGRIMISGVEAQGIPGYPSSGQIGYYFLFPLAVVALLLITGFTGNVVLRAEKTQRVMAIVALLAVLPYMFFFTGGV